MSDTLAIFVLRGWYALLKADLRFLRYRYALARWAMDCWYWCVEQAARHGLRGRR